MTALLRAELVAVRGGRLWWALLLATAALSLLVNGIGGFAGGVAEAVDARRPGQLLLVTLGYSLTLTAVVATVAGIITAGAAFRHRTIATDYLLAGRTPVLAARTAVGGLLGALYGLVAVVVAVPVWLVSRPTLPGVDLPSGAGPLLPDVAGLLQVGAVGVVVCALWGALGAALAVAAADQVGVLVAVLVYQLLVEPVLFAASRTSHDEVLDAVLRLLPGNLGDAAVLVTPAEALAGRDPDLVALLTMVRDPLPWPVGLLLLVAWTALAGVLAAVRGAARDVR
jgi:hypothetical protein